MEFKEFAYTTQKIRTIDIDGEPWFVLKDVCDIFMVSNSGNIAKRLQSDEKRVINIHNVDSIARKRGTPNLTVINEPGLYRAIFTMTPKRIQGEKRAEIESRIDKLEAFKNWVYKEVLPSIRKTGQYVDFEHKFDKLSPISFDRENSTHAIHRLALSRGMSYKDSEKLWREMYIKFSRKLGFNINTKAKAEGITKIEWLENHELINQFNDFIEQQVGEKN